MAEISGIIAGRASSVSPMPRVSRAGGGELGGSARPVQGQEGGNTFVQGEGGRNAAGDGAQARLAPAAGCACGRCASCVARVYQKNKEQSSGRLAKANEKGLQRAESEDTEKQGSTVSGQAVRPDGTALSNEELRQVALLKKIDTQVRAHEMAHVAVAGPYAKGGASFQFQKGPDGQSYAVGGEVPIDTSPEATPEATIAKMRVVRAAALAPADPSPQDRKVAAAATAAISGARQAAKLMRLHQSAKGVDAGSRVAGTKNDGSQSQAEEATGAQSVPASPSGYRRTGQQTATATAGVSGAAASLSITV